MELCKAIVLGIIQGFTEFLPVSSSGHLVIFSEIMDFHEQGLAFDIFLHLGTLAAVMIVFRRELRAMACAPFRFWHGKRDDATRKFLLWDMYIILSTLPAVVVGLFFKDRIESLFGSSFIAYLMLAVTGVLMLATRKLPEGKTPINAPRAVIVGCAQACAILPGLSRSGSTIFAGMALGVPREEIARFSFIMSVPAILGAAVLQVGELVAAPPASELYPAIICGMAAAVIAGYSAIRLLLDVIRKNRLPWFGYYCLAVSFLGLLYHLSID